MYEATKMFRPTFKGKNPKNCFMTYLLLVNELNGLKPNTF